MKKTIFVFSTVFMLLATLNCAIGADIESGLQAVEQEDFLAAFSIFKELAEKNNADAQHNLAVMYKHGKGTMQDLQKAAFWFSKAAEQGLADAQYYLGHMYDNGDGVNQDSLKAASLYEQAAQQGNAAAQTNLGVLYASGEGVKQDIILAYVWLSLGAAQGMKTALDNRNILAESMSDQLITNARKLTSDYFSRYVLPFQTVDKNARVQHSPIGGHGAPTSDTQSQPKPE